MNDHPDQNPHPGQARYPGQNPQPGQNPHDRITILPDEIERTRPYVTPTRTVPDVASSRTAISITREQLDAVQPKPVPGKVLHQRGLMALLGCLVLAIGMLVLAVVVQLIVGRGPWIERLAGQLGSGVVLIETNEDSMGTGFVVASKDGRHLVLTNRHVVGQVDTELTMVLRSGKRCEGTVVGLPTDEDIDLALVIVESQELSPLGRIAYYDRVRIGQEVVAVGHPAGLDYTISQGIVSAKRGNLWLQTSATLSPGNSGGPLINEARQVVGVNTMTMEPDVAQSVGFAVRADLVLQRELWTYSSDVDDLLDTIIR